MSKLHPLAEKAEANEEFARQFGRRSSKATRRKERHERVVARETAWLRSVGVENPDLLEVPVA